MKKPTFFIYNCLLLIAPVLLLSGCTSTKELSKTEPDTHRTTRQTCFLPEASGQVVYENEFSAIDASHLSDGYFMAVYTGSSPDAKLQVTLPDEAVYTYSITANTDAAIPLTGGNGSYHIDVLEPVRDDLYALVFSQDLEVSLTDEFLPFLYPNQYVWFTADSALMEFGITLSEQSSGDLDYLEQVYLYVTKNITYDTELAKNLPLNYIPDNDRTFSAGKGICFDYASLMCALLRSQGIPAKLVVGYSGTAYHAWISVYLEETGWVDHIIQFDGEHWSLMDPTLAAGNDQEAVGKYIGDGSNYLAKYFY